jgi:hypothetical protein
MKLVMKYYVTDCCTYGYDIIVPFEYLSKESAEIDFLELCEKHYKSNHNFRFCGNEFDVSNFFEDGKYLEPTFFLLEDWFKGYKA